jgi:hypothetical protein
MAQRYFQWIAGERKGEVVFFDKIVEESNMSFVAFKDDTRVNSELIAEINETSLSGKMIAEVESPSNIWTFKERIIENKPRYEIDHESGLKYQVPSVEEIMTDGTAIPSQKRVIDIIPPRKTMNKFGRIAHTQDLAGEYNESIATHPEVPNKTPETIPVQPKQQLVSDPVFIMLDKSKKVDTEVNMTLTISLPSTQLFDVARDSFDDGANKALEYIIENIDISDIKTALKAGIEEMYGPNLDPNDNKVISKHDVISAFVTVLPDEQDAEYAGGIFEPECTDEPIIREAKSEESMNELSAELKEKAEKINIGHE